MDKTLRDLQALARVAEELGVTLAIENHQDLTADEIIGLLREVSSPWLGVVLDVANPLGTAEEPGHLLQEGDAVCQRRRTSRITASG